MKRFFSALILLSVFSISFGQNKDTANVNLTNFKLFPGTFSWRGTSTYYDMTAWDSSPFSEGTLKQLSGANWIFRMNYRLLYPGGKLDKTGWDPNYKPGYPMIVFLHGGGERGNCWNGQCYCGTGNGCDVNGTPIADTDPRFLNNDGVLTQGGQTHMNSVVLAGSKKPDDASLDGRAFPGFLLYPQNVNAWGNDNSGNSDLSFALRIVRLLTKQLNIDPNRIYIHGLSLGGQGMYKALNMCDWMFAGAASMSGLDYQLGLEYDSVANIPIWVFQGGTDTQVTPSQSASLVKKFRQAGGIAKYTLYPTLGHGTWNAAYAEPDFFTWFLSQNKANIHVPFGNPNICGTTGAGVNLTLAQGFYAYQWERDGQVIPGATSYTYLATIPGIYRARFSRLSKTPSEAQWNRWSDPVTIGEKTPDVPTLRQTGTVVLGDLNNNKNAILTGPEGFEHYYWYKDGVQTTFAELNVATINGCSPTPTCANTGVYTLVTAGFDLCPSPQSKPKYVVLGVNNSGITPPIITSKPTSFIGTVTSPSSILFTWADNSKNERGYEIWRRTSTDASSTPWKMAILTDEDITQFHDTGLTPGTTYYYKIRAVNNTGRSDYVPGNSTTNTAQHLIISTPLDNTIPTPAQNLIATVTGIQTIKLTWSPAIDDSGIKDYYLYYNSDSVLLGSNATTYTFGKTQLVLNTNYNFTVRAVDLYGNISYKSNQATANTYVDGLYYEHSTGAWTDITTFPWATAVPEFTGKVSDITLAGPPPLGPRTQDDYFNFRFYGYLYITTAGTVNGTNTAYAFQLNSNDGAELYIDDIRQIQRKTTASFGIDGQCTATTKTNLLLTAGFHKIEVRYYDYTGTQCLELRYRGPDTRVGNATAQYILIPPARYRSYNTIIPPVAPQAITNLTATSTSMTQIDLAWTFSGTPPVNFEVYRSTTLDGTYTMIGRVGTASLSDQNLTPGTVYYYKIKTVSDGGTSGFSAVANATTLTDTQAPTQPTGLATTASTFTTISLVWNGSTDNVKVTGYEVWANGTLIGTSSVMGYIATGLLPNTAYSFYVKAYDASGNKSTASSTINASTSVADVYYSNASGNLNAPATWGKNTDGSGTQATTFANNGQYFIVSNRTTSSLGGAWSVDGSISKVIVPNGVTLTVDNTFTAQTEVQGTGTVNLNSVSVPQFIALSPNSTVNYNYTSLGNAYVQKNTYGNLGLYGVGNKVFPTGTTTVLGNITTDAGVAFKGAPGNTSKLVVGGNIVVNGTPAFTAPDFGIDVEMSKNGAQSIIAAGDLYFEKITLTGTSNATTITNTGTPFNINLGTYNGGGLSIPSGSTLNLGNNGIVLAKNSSINGNNETGRLAISDGSLDLTSTSSSSSHLYFDPTNNTSKLLNVNLTGGGSAVVHEAVKITDGIKIKNGTLSSGGNITLISNATNTANIQEIEGTGVITGNVNVQRYIDPKGVVYRYISTSVAGTTEANWETYFPLSGLFVGYIYDHEAWVRIPTTNTNQYAIQKGRGYSVYLRNGASPITVQVAGNPYQGNVTFPLDPDPTTASTDGWNLLGNPYASSIKWSNIAGAWTSSGVSSTVSIRDNPSGVFRYYDYATGLGDLTNGKIAPGQAFWVQVNTTNPSLIITEKAKVAEQQTLFREETKPVSHIKLTLKQGTVEDPTYIAFTNLGTDGFDNIYDAVKQQNVGMFSFSSLTSNNVSTAINNMSDEFCSKSIALNIVNAAAGSYSINATDLVALEGVGQIILRDNFTNTSTVMTPGSSYSFNVTTDAASAGATRFSLVLSRPNLSLLSNATTSDICNAANATVKLTNSQAGATYYAVDNGSAKLSEAYVGNGSDLSITIPVEKLKAGLNNIKLTAGFEGCSTQTLPINLTVNNSVSPTVVTNQSVLGCEGSASTLTAAGAPQGGSYKWFDSNKEQISGVTGSTFQTAPVESQAVYFVSALTSSGCESEKVEITIDGQIVDTPSLVVKNDTLVAIANTVVEWYRNGVKLEGVDSMYYIPTQNGNYKIVSNQNGCSAESQTLEFIVTEIETSADGGLTLVVYPNPAPKNNIGFKVNSTSPSDVDVQFVDILGQTAFLKKISMAELVNGYKTDASANLKSGVYFIIINQEGRSLKKRFFVID